MKWPDDNKLPANLKEQREKLMVRDMVDRECVG